MKDFIGSQVFLSFFAKRDFLSNPENMEMNGCITELLQIISDELVGIGRNKKKVFFPGHIRKGFSSFRNRIKNKLFYPSGIWNIVSVKSMIPDECHWMLVYRIYVLIKGDNDLVLAFWQKRKKTSQAKPNKNFFHNFVCHLKIILLLVEGMLGWGVAVFGIVIWFIESSPP
jgi:hypothetical protein